MSIINSNKIGNRERKIAIITGTTRVNGIGAAICRELAKDGVDIFFSYFREYDRTMPWGVGEKEFELIKREIEAYGVRCVCAELDLSKPENCNELFNIVERELGHPSILINNACYSVNDNLETMTGDNLDRHYEINIRATTLLCIEFCRRFSQNCGGRIVNLTSGQSLKPMLEELSYAITKGAIETITYTLTPAAAVKGITINAVNPGPTDTGWMTEEIKKELSLQFPMNRIGTSDDAAKLIRFLVSDDGGWVTGQIIHSEGGFIR